MEVLLWLFQKINSFPKKQRFVLGQRIENTGLEILKLIIQANNEKNTAKKLECLKEINTQLRRRSAGRENYHRCRLAADNRRYRSYGYNWILDWKAREISATLGSP